MSSVFLTKDNFAKLYSNIKDIILSNDGFNLDSDKKYKKALKKMAISFHEKNLNQTSIDKMNNDALNKFIPFIQSILAKSSSNNNAIQPFDLSGDIGGGVGLNSGNEMLSSNINDSFNNTYSNNLGSNGNDTKSFQDTENTDDFMKRLSNMENERNKVMSKDSYLPQRNDLSIPQPISSRELSRNDDNNSNNQQKKMMDNITNYNPQYNPDINVNIDMKRNPNNAGIQNQLNKLSLNTPAIPELTKLPRPAQTNQQSPNITNYEPLNIMFDTGTSSNPKVNNKNKKYWINFTVPFQNPVNIPGNRTLYLENLIIYGIDTPESIPYFFIEIEEFKAGTVTNDFKPTKGISIFNNSSNNTLVSYNQNRKLINLSNQTLNQLTINIHTNTEDKESIFESSNMTNRIIMEFKVV